MKDSHDLLKGAKEAAEALGLSPREIYHLLDQGLIPAKKLGGRWYFYRNELLNSFRVNAHKSDVRPDLVCEPAEALM